MPQGQALRQAQRPADHRPTVHTAECVLPQRQLPTPDRPPAAEVPEVILQGAAQQAVTRQEAVRLPAVTDLPVRHIGHPDHLTGHHQAEITLLARREVQAATRQAEAQAHILLHPAVQAVAAEVTPAAGSPEDHPEAQAVPTAAADREAVAEEGK